MGTLDDKAKERFVLRNLPLASRMVLACFLMSVGIGYCSALVQLHFKGGTKPGQVLPGPEEAMKTYAGERGPRPQSAIERLIEADESLKLDGKGQMRTAFTKKSDYWNRDLNKAKETGEQAVKKLRDEREGERQAMLEWLRAGAPEPAYEKDDFTLSDALKDQPITEEFVVKEEGMPRRLKIKTLIAERCVCCHAPEPNRRFEHAEQYRLDNYAAVKKYAVVQVAGGMSLDKLAQTTHVHLLGFSMLYGMTGLIFSLTSYWGWVRFFVAPFALLMQVIDISCWWLARLPSPYGDMFGQAIAVTGALVAVGLLTQIMGSLWDLFNTKGKCVLVLVILGGLAGAGLTYQQVIHPFLESEKAPAATAKE